MSAVSKTVFRNSMWGVIGQLAIKALSFLFTVFVVRHLGPEIYGQYAGILAFGGIFVNFADLGLAVYLVRQTAQLRAQAENQTAINQLFANVSILRFLLALLTAVTIILMAWLTGKEMIFVGAVALGTLGLIMYSVQGTAEAMLSGFERLDWVAGQKIVYQLIFVVLGAAALYFGFGYYGLIYANLLGIAVITWLCWRGVQRLNLRWVKPNWRQWLPLLHASLPFAIVGFALGLSYRFDSVLLSYRSDYELGLYSSAYNLVFNAALLSNSFNTALYPSLSRQAVTDRASLPRLYEHAVRYLLVLALPIAAGIWALADQVTVLLFDQQYAAGASALAILIWVVPLMYISEFLGYVVLIDGQERFVARSVVFSSVLNVTANILLIPTFGFMAAAVMTVVTEAVLVAQYLWLLRDLLKKMNWVHILVRPLIATGAMTAVVLLLHANAVSIWVSVAAGAIVYGALVLALGVLGKNELRFVRNLRSNNNAVAPQ